MSQFVFMSRHFCTVIPESPASDSTVTQRRMRDRMIMLDGLDRTEERMIV